MDKQQKQIPENLRTLAVLSKLMDEQLTIPGTKIKFGLDGLIGLIPGVGDLATFAISAIMLGRMAENGASGNVMARMVLNVLIDTVIGSIPVLGDLFDFAFKANMKNFRLMEAHYIHGRHRGGAWKIIVPVLLLVLLVIIGIIYLTHQLFQWLLN